MKCFYPVDTISTKTLSALAKKSAGRDDDSVETIAGSLIAISTSLFMAINLGSIATDATSYTILGMAFLLNVKDVAVVARHIRGGEEKFEEACFAFQDLTINMCLEIILPLSYLACFLLASAGDNANVLGNIGNSYWHYQVTSTSSSDQLP